MTPFWKGYLKLSLVTCPVAMTPATTESDKVRFHTLNRRTGNRVVSQYVDAASGRPVDEDDQVKGYQQGEDAYVVLEDDELAAVALDSARSIDIERFVPAGSVEWIWYETPHFLTPDGAVGEEAFCVVRDAMAATGMVGMSRLVLYRRERAVMLEPRDRGILLWTLRFGDEVRDADAVFRGIGDAKPDPKLKRMMASLIRERTVDWDPGMLHDPVQEQLRTLIAARKKGRPRARKDRPEARPSHGNVISMMDALRNSLAAEGKGRRRRGGRPG